MRQQLPQLAERATPCLPFGAALRKPIEQRFGGGQRRLHPVAANDRVLERLQRGDVADADMAIAVARGHRGVGLPCGGNHQQYGEEHRHDGRARDNGELQKGRMPPFSHARARCSH